MYPGLVRERHANGLKSHVHEPCVVQVGVRECPVENFCVNAAKELRSGQHEVA